MSPKTNTLAGESIKRTPHSDILSSSDYTPVSSKEFLDIQANIECGFTMKHVCDMTRTYSQMHRTDKFSQLSSIIWSVWPNG